MHDNERNSDRELEKEISIEKCIEKSQRIIDKNGICLFLMDVAGSKRFTDRQELQNRLLSLTHELNNEFDQYFPENKLATCTRTEKGFSFFIGDGTWAGINNSEVISKIVDYSTNNYPDISFHYNVAVDGWDEEGTRVVK